MGNIGNAVTFISKSGAEFNDLLQKADANPVLLELPKILGKDEVPPWLEDLLWEKKAVTVQQVQEEFQKKNIFEWVVHQHPTGPYWGPPKASQLNGCLLYTSPSPRDGLLSRMPSSA